MKLGSSLSVKILFHSGHLFQESVVHQRCKEGTGECGDKGITFVRCSGERIVANSVSSFRRRFSLDCRVLSILVVAFWPLSRT